MLFEINETLSPFEQWKREKLILVEKTSEEFKPFLAYRNESEKGAGCGDNEAEAIAELCAEKGIETFDAWRIRKAKGGE